MGLRWNVTWTLSMPFRRRLDIHRVVNNNLLPKVSVALDEILVDGMILVSHLSRRIIEEHEFRSAVGCIHHISFFRVGGDANVQLADGFYLSQASKTFQQLRQVLVRIAIFQPKENVMN